VAEIIQATEIGKHISSLLVLNYYTGKVLSVVSDAIFLLGENDEIFWLTDQELRHSRAILIPCLPSDIATQSVFVLSNGLLNINHSAVIDLGRAHVWKYDFPGPITSLQAKPVLSRVKSLLARIDSKNCLKGLSVYIPMIMRRFENEGPDLVRDAVSDPVLLAALEPIHEIISSMNQKDFSNILDTCGKLIGLGYGLTPSGDDFVGAIFYSLRIFQTIYPEIQGLNDTNLSTFLSTQQFKTNVISYCILKDMCFGEAPEACASFLCHLLFTSSSFELENSMIQLTKIGHSTGWDTLAGIMTACLCLTKTIQ